MKNLLGIFKETISEFGNDNATRLSAALAYYTIFSIAPLLVIAIAIAALVLGQQGATEQISYQVRDLVGDAGAASIQTMVESANKPKSGILAVIVGIITLLFGASGAFGELQSSMNVVWDAPPAKGSGFWKMIKDRFLSFSMVLGTGFLLMVSLVLSAGIAALGKVLTVPGFEAIAHVINMVLSIVVLGALFAMMFKFLPDVIVRWRDVWLGALFTATLFTIGKFALGLYLGKSAVVSSYGAAGSLIVILLWVYYSSMILFFGAEFTEVYSRHHGSRRGETA